MLSLEQAVSEFMTARSDLRPSAARGYRSALADLVSFYPDRSLDSFEPPAGSKLIDSWLKKRWRDDQAQSYRKYLSVTRTFFQWHCDAGNLTQNPTDGLTYPAIHSTPRRLITRDETETLFAANPDPRDQVPLRLLLTAGLQKGPLRHLRFRDFDPATKTVSYERSGQRYTAQIADKDFWVALRALRDQRHAKDKEYVLPAQVPRKYNAKSDEIAAMERDGVIDDEGTYLFQKWDGRWYRARVKPHVARDEHGVQIWWYRCLERAGFVAPGAKSGFTMQSARYTFGRRHFTRLGNLAELQRELGGLGHGGTTHDIYRDNSDLLNRSIRVMRRRVRLKTLERINRAVGIDGKRPLLRWWKEPLAAFADYVDDERDLIELSRVSVEMLRTQDAASEQLHEATETLTRAVTTADLVKRAESESREDHPLLHGHSLVAIWSAVETMVSDLAEAWLLCWPPARTTVAGVVPVTSLQGLPPDEWVAAVRQALDRRYQKLNRDPRSPRRLDFYEWLLASVGLPERSQDRDEGIYDNLWDMQQIRNVFAHKRGIADRRLKHNNPGLPFRVGEQIRINRNAWSDFLVTTVLYADEIARRMKRELDLPDWQRVIPAPRIRYHDQETSPEENSG